MNYSELQSNVIKYELVNSTFTVKEMVRAEAISRFKRYGFQKDMNKFINNQTNSSNFRSMFLYLKFKEDILTELNNNGF